MKKIFFPLIGIAIFCFSFTTGGKDLPAAVQSGILNRYPAAHIKSWEMKKNQYIIKVEEDKAHLMTWYSADGSWIRTEKHIALTKDLPASVQKGLEGTQYKSWYVDNIKEITTNTSAVMYVLHVDNSNKLDADHVEVFKKDYRLYFTADGTLTKKVSS